MTSRVTLGARKARLLERFDSKCYVCGYDRLTRALHFHHLDSSEKRKWSEGAGGASFDEVEAHPERFRVLCATCHIETHDAMDTERRMRTQASCIRCGKGFDASASRHADVRHGKYCGRPCYSAERRTMALAANSTRFWKFISHVGEHWVWTGNKVYSTPILSVPVEGRRRWVALTAYRVSHEIQHGKPAATKLRRYCEQELCVRHVR